MPFEQGMMSRVIRALGFVKKEIVSVARQPRLIVTLIVAPFAILLVFGLGYRTQPPPFKTLLVLPGEEAGLAADRENLSEAFGDNIELEGTSTDATEARSRLRSGEVDLLIIGPADPLHALDEGDHAEFVVVHSEVDPVIRSSISLLARLSVNELNQRILEGIVSRSQTQSEDIEDPLTAMRTGASDLVTALEGEDAAREERAREDLSTQLSDLETGAGSGTNLYSSVADALGTDNESAFDTLRSQLEATESGSDADSLEAARQLEERLVELETQLNRAQSIEAPLLVSPFSAVVQDIADLPATPAFFYAPATVVILIQHLAVTFAALSVVTERQLGLTEIFRVSPLSPTEILVGKYLAFLSIAAGIGAVLGGAMIAVGVPMRGSLLYFALVLLLVIVASLGLGFLISGVAKNDGQAVQYSMMLLLVSIFFTGFILPLEQLIPPVRAISYLIPGTYGIASLHNVMFRGLNPELLIIWGLAGYSLVAAVGSWWVVRRDVTTSVT